MFLWETFYIDPTVKIGPGCEIDRVEYSRNIEIAEGPKVRKKVRIFYGGTINE